MAHGLVLRMKDYLEKLDTKKELPSNEQKPVYVPVDPDQSSEVVQIIRSWVLVTKNSKNSKMEFFSLLRQTLLFMLSSEWSTCMRKNDLLHAYGSYYQKFSSITKNAESIYIAVIQLSNDPWHNSFFQWEDLSRGKVNIDDKKVQSYFKLEPEEIILARCQSLASREKLEIALYLAKLSFLYQSRVRKNIAQPKNFSPSAKEKIDSASEEEGKDGQASIDWYITILRRKSLSVITEEFSLFTCHEGIEIICRIKRNPKLKKFLLVVLKIFLIQELMKPSTFCCTKKLFQLFCQVHKELHSSEKEIIESARKIFAIHAPTSSHLYLFVDAMWEQFGLKFNSLIQVYTEFYVRGLTADINYLETARNSDVSCDISGLESHIAGIFIKLSTLFRNSSEEAARECTFSAFSLKPSKSKLVYLKNLNQTVQSKLAELSENVNPDLAFRDCTCSRICNGYCRISTIDHNFVHPLLKKGIRNISYSLVKDLVCILESVRIINFQYNLFNWSDGLPALSSHLQSRVIPKPQKSSIIETMQEPEHHSNSLKNNSNSVQEVTEVLSTKLQSPQALIKRKHSSEDSTQSSFLDVGANIEVNNEDSSSKKIKVCDTVSQIQNISELSQNYNSKHKVNDAIEKVIRLSMSNKMTQEGILNPIEPISSATTANHSFSAMNLQQKDNFAHSEQFKQVLTSDDNLHEQFELEIPKPQVFKLVEKNKSAIKQSIERPSVLFKTNDSVSQEKASHFQKSDKQLSLPVVPAYSVNSAQCTNNVSNSINIPQKPLIQTNSVKCLSDVSHSVSLPQRYLSQTTAKSSNPVSHSVNVSQKSVVQASSVNSSKYQSNTIHSAHKDEHWKDNFKFTTFQSKPLEYSKVKNANETYVENVSALNLSSRPTEVGQKTNFQNKTYEGQNFKCNKNVTEKIINSTFNQKSTKSYQDTRENCTVTSTFMETQPKQKTQSDRNSVIQHTMQHLGIKIPTQLSVSLNSSEQMNISEKKCSTLSAKVKIPVKSIPKYNSDNPLQPIFHPPNAHLDQNLTKYDNREVTSVPGNLPPTSVIKRKPPWHAPSVYDKVEVKKEFHSSTSTTKESYSIQKEHFSDSSRKELMKKTEITKKETVYQIYKTKQNKDNIKAHYNPINITNYGELPVENSTSYSTSHHNQNKISTSSNIIHEDRISGAHMKSTKSCFENPSISFNQTKTAHLSKYKNLQSSCFTKDLSDGKTKLFRVDPYSRAPVLVKENSSKASATQVFNRQSTSHNNDRTSILKPSLAPSPTSSNSNIYKMHHSILKAKMSQNLSVVTENMLKTNSPITYSPAPSSASSINLASNTNSPVPWDSSRSNSSYYDPSLYSSSSILLEDDKGVVAFKAAKGMPPASQPSIEPTASKTCCSPLEVNPCQTCSVSSDFKHSGSSNSVVELELPSSAENSVSLVPEFPPEITITRKNESIPTRSNKFNTIFDDLQHEKYTTCHICSVSCAVSELNTHYGNCHPYELIKRNTSQNINSYDYDSSSLGCLVQDSDKVIYKDHFDKKIHKNKSDEIIGNNLQNDFDDCINLMSSSASFDGMNEIFDNVNDPINYSNQQNYKFSEMFKENHESDPLSNSESINAAMITEEINLITPSLNKTKENNSLNEMLEYLTNQTVEVPQFDTSKLETSQSKDFQDPSVAIKSRKQKPNYKPSKHIHCKLCGKKYSTTTSFGKHAKNFHPEVTPRVIMDIQTKPLKTLKNIPVNMNYPGMSNNSQFHETQRDTFIQEYQVNKNVKQLSNSDSCALSENLNSTSISAIPFPRKQKKATLKECKFCGTMLTTTFMKQHILRYHSSASTNNNSTGGAMFFTDHHSKASYQNRPSTISIPDLQDNIDSNTCLSISDALNTNVKFEHLTTDVDLQNQIVNIKQEPIDFHSNEEKVEDYLPNFQINQSSSSLNNSSSKIQNDFNNECSYEPSMENISNSYTCNFCMRNYTSQSFLNKHIRTFHGIQNLMESQLSQEAPILNVSNSNSIMSIPPNNSELFCEGFDEQNMSQNYEQNDFDLLNSLQFDSVNQNDSKLFNNHSSVSQTNNAYLSNSLGEVEIENSQVTPFWENVNQPQLNSWPQNVLNPVEIVSNQKGFSTENDLENFPPQSDLVDNQIDCKPDIFYQGKDTPVLQDTTQIVDSNLHTFDDKNNLNLPLSSKPKTVKFPCEICSKTFTSNYFLQRHKVLKHNSSDLNCTSGNDSGINDNSLGKGKMSEKKTSRSKIKARNLKNISISPKIESLDLKDLLSFNKGSMDRVRCKICGQYSSHRGNLKTHMINVHKINESELITRRRSSSQDSNKTEKMSRSEMYRRRSSSQDSSKTDTTNESEIRLRRRSSRDSNKMANNGIVNITPNVQISEKETQIHQTDQSTITNLKEEEEVLKSNELNSDVPFDNSNLKYSEKVRCKICLKVYSNRGTLKTHIKTIHPNDSLKQRFSKEYEQRGKIAKKRVQCSICMKLLWNTSLYLHMKVIHNGLKSSAHATISTAAAVPNASVHKENDLEYIKRIANRSFSSINPDAKKSDSISHLDIKNKSQNNSSDNITSAEFIEESIVKGERPATSSTISTFCQNFSDDDSDSLPPLDELTPIITEFRKENSGLDSENADSLDTIIPSIMNNITESNTKNEFSGFLNETNTNSEIDAATMMDIERQCEHCLDNLIELISQKHSRIDKNCSFPIISDDKINKTKSNADFIDGNSLICDKPDSFNLIKLIDPVLNASDCDPFDIFSENTNISDLNPSNLSDKPASNLKELDASYTNINSDAIDFDETSKTVLSKKLKCNIDLETESLSNTKIPIDKFKKRSKYKEFTCSKQSVAKDKRDDANDIDSQTATRVHRNECRVCHKKFKSMMLLSKHLKIVHNIPYLKKLKTTKLKLDEKDSERLSPPPLTYKNFDQDSASQFIEGPQIFSEKNSSSTAVDEDELTRVSIESCNDFTGVGPISEKSSLPCSNSMKRSSSDNAGVSLRKRKSSTSNHSLSNSDFNENLESIDSDFAQNTRYNFRDVAAYSSFTPVASSSDRIKATNCSKNTVRHLLNSDRNKATNFPKNPVRHALNIDKNRATNCSKPPVRVISSSDTNKSSNCLKPPVQLISNNDETSYCPKSPVPPVVIKLLRSGENFTIENKEQSEQLRLKLKRKNGIESQGYVFHNSKSDSFPNSCVLTFKYPQDVSIFLKEHKQPTVQLVRLEDDFIKKFTAKTPHFDVSSPVSILSSSATISVLDQQETIDDKRPTFPVPENIMKPLLNDSTFVNDASHPNKIVTNQTSLVEPVLNDSSVVNDAFHPIEMVTNQTSLVEPVVKESSVVNDASHSIEMLTNRTVWKTVLNNSSFVTDSSHPSEMVTNQTSQEPVSNSSSPSQTKKNVAVVLKKLKIDVNDYNNHNDNFSTNQLNGSEDRDISYYLKFPVLKECSVLLTKL